MPDPGYIVEFAYRQPWLSADHLAFIVRRARKDGRADRRWRHETVTLPVALVLAHQTLDACLRALTARGDRCTYGRQDRLLGHAVRGRLHLAGQWQSVADAYPVARDYLLDHC